MDKELFNFLDEMWIDYPPSASEVAEALADEGYHRTIWHKISDKLPEKPAYYYCHCKGFHCNSGEAYIGNHEMFWNGDKFVTDWTNEIIAWTDLPIYEE